MLRQLDYSRSSVSELERRLRSLERRLDRAGVRVSTGASDAADRVGEIISAALSGVTDRFRGGPHLTSEEAAKLGGEAAKLGRDALRRLSREVEHRPLILLAVAVGLGIVVGVASQRR